MKLDCQSCKSRLLGVMCNLEDSGIQDCNLHKTTNVYHKGQVIFYEGNQAYGLYCIFSGKVKLYKSGVDGKHQIIRIAGPGDLLGYRSLFAEEPYSATAEALEEATICCMDKNAFSQILPRHPELAVNIIKKLAKELRAAEDLAMSIAHKSVRERMAELLLMLKDTYGIAGKKGIRIDLHLTREEMGEMIGITQETTIRLLSEFKHDKIIAVEEREITILDPKALLKTARIEV
jgi:cAMP-binding proteins - catabolite gene activator and regulatory subunit of cAMP-dependent protein kinases